MAKLSRKLDKVSCNLSFCSAKSYGLLYVQVKRKILGVSVKFLQEDPTTSLTAKSAVGLLLLDVISSRW